MRYLVPSLLAFLIFSEPCLPAVYGSELFGQVIGIIDGDTIEVMHNGKAQRIRLQGIDCPEKGQAFGNNAKQAISALVFAMDVTIQIRGKDRYGRILGDVLLVDGTNVNHQLVKEGWCWWFRKYAPMDTELESLEKEGREAKKGLWADPAPVPPWAFRNARSGQSLGISDLVPLNDDADGNVSSRGRPLLGAIDNGAFPSSTPYPMVGNRRTRIYHRADCPNYSQVKPGNRISFKSAAEAEAAGYRLASNCP